MNRLCVLSVINTLYFGGDQSRLLSLAKGIDRRRFRHIVLTLKRPDPQRERHFGSLRTEFTGAGIDVACLDVDEPASPAHGTLSRVARSAPRLLRTLRKLTAFIRANNVDVVDAHIGTANQLGALAAMLTRRPAVLTTYQLEQFRPLWLWNASEALAFSASAAVVTDSDPVADQIRRKLLRHTTVAVIPNGIEPPPSTRTSAEMRAMLNLPLDPHVRIIGQVSSLSPRKGHLILLEAARAVLESEPSAHFLFCGFVRTPQDYERIHGRAVELGIAANVTIAGYPGPIGDVYRAIDIQVHAATGESLPNAIIEGMALAKPAAVAAVAGIPSMVTDDDTGLVVPPADAPALAHALLRLLRDPDLAKRLGEAAQTRYFSRYTEAHMARALEQLFDAVARAGAKELARA